MISFCSRWDERLLQNDIKLDNHNIYFQHRISLILLTNFYPESTLTALVRVQTEFVETKYFWKNLARLGAQSGLTLFHRVQPEVKF